MNPIRKIFPLESKEEISDLAKRLLIKAGVWGKVPTPRDEIISFSELHLHEDLPIEEQFIKRLGRSFISTLKKIRGILDVRQKVIFVDPSQHPKKQLWTTYHEIGHNVIPWQRDLFYRDDEISLDPWVQIQFEAEANFFAADIIFQVDQFKKEIMDYLESKKQ